MHDGFSHASLMDDCMLQALADRISAWFVPAVLGMALATFTIWMCVAFLVLPPSSLPAGTSPFLLALMHTIRWGAHVRDHAVEHACAGATGQQTACISRLLFRPA